MTIPTPAHESVDAEVARRSGESGGGEGQRIEKARGGRTDRRERVAAQHPGKP
ncbi:hypothetical protein [Amycolatopsis sp. WQ 127309]|uniref:hypothetical protein n=1 Tax=Amycolatopsis sp. WQ 127309 TaxID=2932773 RepID=UPI001FF457D8|nr:hypothetical protein [Amycolatopsis sp. WQ 127309]UOZ11261.1 hypothetical protein MUY22_24545 [Amycolatopsis sp. WQ 127309]